jgi:hypothetical protein
MLLAVDYYDLLNVFIFGARIMHCFFRLAWRLAWSRKMQFPRISASRS